METRIHNLVSTKMAWHYQIIPSQIEGNTLTCFAVDSQINETLINELCIALNTEVCLIPISHEEIIEKLKKHYPESSDLAEVEMNLSKPETILDNIIQEAFILKSSDIHIEPEENICKVRYRLDGKLIEKYAFEKQVFQVLLNKLKIKSKLDISEKRLPQDGRLMYRDANHSFDIRVSTLPTLHGEKAVLRLLKKDASHLSLDGIGMTSNQLELFKRGLSQNQGLILISGPTGSGKTTTLYAAMKVLNKKDRNILTIEDPIEYTLDGLNQVQLREDIGLSYPRALRSFLRQDPDVIMVGEIRDDQTASMALRASLTGHLVMSTIHTNSAWETIERLEDLGVPRFSVSSTLIVSIAQRLLRKLCPACKKQVNTQSILTQQLIDELNILDSTFEPVGCERCFFTGYYGRTAIYEMIEINAEIRKAIKNKMDEDGVHSTFGIIPLRIQAKELVHSGTTSLEEAMPLLLAK